MLSIQVFRMKRRISLDKFILNSKHIIYKILHTSIDTTENLCDNMGKTSSGDHKFYK